MAKTAATTKQTTVDTNLPQPPEHGNIPPVNQPTKLSDLSTSVRFPTDEYTDAMIIAYTCANCPGGKFAKTNDLVPSVKFLFSTEDGIRKWSRWFKFSTHAKSAMTLFFPDHSVSALTNDEDLLFSTVFRVLAEESASQYINLIKAKSGGKPMKTIPSYGEDRVPYRTQSAYGNIVEITLAKAQINGKIVTWTTSDCQENPNAFPVQEQ